MKFRQLGILLMVGGFLTGSLMATLSTRAGMQAMATAAGAANPADMALTSARALTFQVWGHVVALLGLVIYFYGVLTSRSGGNTTVIGEPR
jgi:MFS-type transporter involved in bile tolerance (Atg22 family)